MSNDALIKVNHNVEALSKIDQVARECDLMAASGGGGGIVEVFRMASGVQQLRNLITDAMMTDIMQLQGTPLGFRTDRDRPKRGENNQGPLGYDVRTVKDVVIEATLRGARMVGNEVNIIASSCYLTREYFTRKLREFPGLSNLRIVLGAPVKNEKTSRYHVAAMGSWEINGVQDSIEKAVRKIGGMDDGKEIDERFVLKYDQYTTEDAILGKVDRKFKALIYARLTGTIFKDGDVSEEGSTPPARIAPATQSVAAITQKLKSEKVEKESSDPEPKPDTPEPGGQQPLFSEPQSGKPWKDALHEDLCECETIGSVSAIEQKYVKFAQNDSDRAHLAGECDQRKGQIRDDRAK